jgi:acyl-CoA hydrolase
VFAERRREGRKQVVRVTEAQLTYVAVDDQRRPRVVPPGDGLVEV